MKFRKRYIKVQHIERAGLRRKKLSTLATAAETPVTQLVLNDIDRIIFAQKQ